MTLTRCLKAGAVLLLLCPVLALASSRDGYGDVEVLEVVSVYDADTFRVNIAGWPYLIGKNIAIRADGFDAPEIRGQGQSEKIAAIRARNLTVNVLAIANRVELRNIRRGKYFRIITDCCSLRKVLSTIPDLPALSSCLQDSDPLPLRIFCCYSSHW